MTDCGRSTSVRSGWVGCTKRRAASWIISAALLAEKVGITRECVTNQLITKCHLSSELFSIHIVSATQHPKEKGDLGYGSLPSRPRERSLPMLYRQITFAERYTLGVLRRGGLSPAA